MGAVVFGFGELIIPIPEPPTAGGGIGEGAPPFISFRIFWTKSPSPAAGALSSSDISVLI
jgi:hypothetical protein